MSFACIGISFLVAANGDFPNRSGKHAPGTLVKLNLDRLTGPDELDIALIDDHRGFELIGIANLAQRRS